eukprot:797495-Prymnesium_polylepis.1
MLLPHAQRPGERARCAATQRPQPRAATRAAHPPPAQLPATLPRLHFAQLQQVLHLHELPHDEQPGRRHGRASSSVEQVRVEQVRAASRNALRTYARATFPNSPRFILIPTITLLPTMSPASAEGPSHISRYSSSRGNQKPPRGNQKPQMSAKRQMRKTPTATGAPVKSLEKAQTHNKAPVRPRQDTRFPPLGGAGGGRFGGPPLTCGR